MTLLSKPQVYSLVLVVGSRILSQVNPEVKLHLHFSRAHYRDLLTLRESQGCLLLVRRCSWLKKIRIPSAGGKDY